MIMTVVFLCLTTDILMFVPVSVVMGVMFVIIVIGGMMMYVSI